jgi:hypothetical protein
MYCRGGPPWPPGVELDPLQQESIEAFYKEIDSTPGGHGGPPLQCYSACFKKSFVRSS